MDYNMNNNKKYHFKKDAPTTPYTFRKWEIMAYIRRRKFRFKASYIAQVKRKGFKTIVKSFDTKTQAQKWARGIERKIYWRRRRF